MIKLSTEPVALALEELAELVEVVEVVVVLTGVGAAWRPGLRARMAKERLVAVMSIAILSFGYEIESIVELVLRFKYISVDCNYHPSRVVQR